MALYQEGERWQLDSETNKKMMEINSRYEVEDPLQFDLFETYNIKPAETEKQTATAEIIKKLKDDGHITGGTDQQLANRIGNILTKLGCENVQTQVNGQRARRWVGVWQR